MREIVNSMDSCHYGINMSTTHMTYQIYTTWSIVQQLKIVLQRNDVRRKGNKNTLRICMLTQVCIYVYLYTRICVYIHT